MSRFKIGDVIRCKRKFSHFYRITNIYALCKVMRNLKQNKYRREAREMARYNDNIRVVVIGHKNEAYVDSEAFHDVYDFRFRKATERDKKQFMLYAL